LGLDAGSDAGLVAGRIAGLAVGRVDGLAVGRLAVDNTEGRVVVVVNTMDYMGKGTLALAYMEKRIMERRDSKMTGHRSLAYRRSEMVDFCEVYSHWSFQVLVAEGPHYYRGWIPL